MSAEVILTEDSNTTKELEIDNLLIPFSIDKLE